MLSRRVHRRLVGEALAGLLILREASEDEIQKKSIWPGKYEFLLQSMEREIHRLMDLGTHTGKLDPKEASDYWWRLGKIHQDIHNFFPTFEQAVKAAMRDEHR